MRFPRAVGPACGGWLLAALLGCGSSRGDGSQTSGGGDTGSGNATGTGNDTGRGGSSASGGGPDLGLGDVPNDPGASGSSSSGECAGERIDAKRLPLDIYVMLDVSGSMLQETQGDANVTKWQAVTSALTDFGKDPASAGISVGLQVFPLKHPDAPATCSASAQCAPDFGECLAKICWQFTGNNGPCESDHDCGDISGDCVSFGSCKNDDSFVCRNPGGDCGTDTDTGKALGACVPQTPVCTAADDCRAIDYAMPAVPIAELPGAQAKLLSAIAAQKPDRTGLTPTGPALAGALSLSKTWAQAHLDHQVITLLATDGIPTLQGTNQVCTELTSQADLDKIAKLASDAKSTAPSISTFVIGVLGPDDAAASAVLQSIAMAGGSGDAFIVDTRGNVQAQFREALDQIRGGLSCELAVPKADAGTTVDYDKVNVDFTHASGQVEHLAAVDTAADCGTQRAWHYDVDPATAAPTRILACPELCTEFRATDTGSVEISLGCTTRRVPK